MKRVAATGSCWVSPYGTAQAGAERGSHFLAMRHVGGHVVCSEACEGLGPRMATCCGGSQAGGDQDSFVVAGTSLATILPRPCAALLGFCCRACLRLPATQFGANFGLRRDGEPFKFSLLDAPTGCEARFCLANAKLSLLGSFGFLAYSNFADYALSGEPAFRRCCPPARVCSLYRLYCLVQATGGGLSKIVVQDGARQWLPHSTVSSWHALGACI